jgi:hypothetical protein
MTGAAEQLETTNPEAHIHQVRFRVFEKARVYRRAMDSGRENVELKQELAHAILDYYDELWRDRDEPVAKGQWENLNIESIERHIGQHVSVQAAPAGRGQNPASAQRPAVASISYRKLRDELRKLDEIYKSLGYSPDVNEADRPTGVIDFEQ